MNSLQHLFGSVVAGFKWRTMQGHVLYLHEMDTGHIFNSMKMIFNHVASIYGGEPVWFTKNYINYTEKAMDKPDDLVKLVALFCYEIEKRGDLPSKYGAPYENIVRQLLGNELMNQAVLDGQLPGERRSKPDMIQIKDDLLRFERDECERIYE